ncbi:radical SAM protein [Candidatus Woesearchaeota archaeon]|nr:radical SAM protein [Candidatus Woesearchaeota archaeon]
MQTVLIHAPFCTPASPPYSLAYLYSFLQRNGHRQLGIIDLNLEYHRQHYSKYFAKLQHTVDLKALLKETSKEYAATHRTIRKGREPEDTEQFINNILETKANTAVFSIVYSSQAFYAYALIKKLKEKGITTIIGGPAVTPQLAGLADLHLNNEIELLEALQHKPVNHENLDCRTLLDYSAFPLHKYFSPQPVLPIKTCTACYYQRCAFCTHHQSTPYREFSLHDIATTIKKSGQTYFFFIDDMIHKKRLLDLAAIIQPLGIRWMCQLRPTRELDKNTLQTLYDAGLRVVLWGVESGSQRVLDLMNKGTKVCDISRVLQNAKDVGITNVTFIMFGFPTETTEEFLQTIQFLKNNSYSIDLVSTSVFGLQRNAPAFNNPQQYGINTIHTEQRDLLDTKITYTPTSGLTTNEAAALKRKYTKTLQRINKVAKEMNFFREHLLTSKD